MENSLTKQYTRNIIILSIIPLTIMIVVGFININRALTNINISEQIREDAYGLIAQYYEIGYLQEERELSVLYGFNPNNSNLENLAIHYDIEYEYLDKLGGSLVQDVYDTRDIILKKNINKEKIIDKYSLFISKFISTLAYKNNSNITDKELIESIQSYKILLQLNENYSLQHAHLLKYIMSENKESENVYQLLSLRNKKEDLIKSLKLTLSDKFIDTLNEHITSEDFIKIEKLINNALKHKKIKLNTTEYLQNIKKVRDSLFVFNNNIVSNIDGLAVKLHDQEMDNLIFVIVISLLIILFSLIFGTRVKNSILQNINQNINKINEKNKEIEGLFNQVNSLLDNANEGFLSFENDLLIKDGCSHKSFEILNNKNIVNKNIADILFENDDNKNDVLKFGLKNIFDSDDENNKQMLLSLLPSENKINNIIFTIEYKLIHNDTECMVILEDVTVKRALEEKIEHENKVQKMIISIATRKHEFLELKNEFKEFLENIKDQINLSDNYENNLTNIKKTLHTFKGRFAQEELVNIPNAIHEVENKIFKYSKKDDTNSENLLKLILNNTLYLDHSLQEDLDFISKVLGKDFLYSRNMMLIDEENYKKLSIEIMNLVFNSKTVNNELKLIAHHFLNLNQKSLKHMLSIYPKRVKNIAHRLDKEIHDFEIEGDPTIFVQVSYSTFIQSLVHLFRNIMVHGIEENPEDRINLGKDAKGKIECKFYYNDNHNIELIISDDGCGIDIEKIKKIALEKNIYNQTELENMKNEDILNIIFQKDFSTKKESDLLSGRGVGLNVIKHECDNIGANIKVESKKGYGVKFIFTIPSLQEQLPIELPNNEEELSKNILDVTSNYIKNELGIEIKDTIILPNIDIMKHYSTIKLSNDNEVISTISLDDSVLTRLLSMFCIDNIEDVTNEMLNDVLNETLNTVIGLSINSFPEYYKNHELSTTVVIDRKILEQFENQNISYNYQIQTADGNINISTIFINQ